MIRDDFPNITHEPNLTDSTANNSVTFTTTVLIPFSRLKTQRYRDVITQHQPGVWDVPENKSVLADATFFTYKPETGINTASVLGGLLVILVIYVIYRTKCRKRIINVCRKCTMKYLPEEFGDGLDNRDVSQKQNSNGDSEYVDEKTKMLSPHGNIRNAALSCDKVSEIKSASLEKNECFQSEQVLQCPGNDYADGNIASENTPGNQECTIDMESCQLPDLEQDIEQTTAQWVQNVQDMDIKERHLNGIILKIPSDLLSQTNKMRRHFCSVTEYSEIAGDMLDTVSSSPHRNISLPNIVVRRTYNSDTIDNQPKNYAISSQNVEVSLDNRLAHGSTVVPLASQENVDLDFEINDTDPPVFARKDTNNPKIPLDICPVVKVHHYHSRSKRRLTSLCHSTSDDSASSGADDINGGILLSSAPNSKCKKLHTCGGHCRNHDKNSIYRANGKSSSSSRPQCKRKGILRGVTSETVL